MTNKKDEKQTSHEYTAFGMPPIVKPELGGLDGVLMAERLRRLRVAERSYKRKYPTETHEKDE